MGFAALVVGSWKQLFLINALIQLAALTSFNPTTVLMAEAVAAASEWPLGLPDEYTTAWINITYRGRNGTLITEKSQVSKLKINFCA